MTQWYDKKVAVTLTHGQWATVLLALWDSMAHDEMVTDISEGVKEMRVNEKLDIRDLIHAHLPLVPQR